jgi:broad specificity phosphatase PhoE
MNKQKNNKLHIYIITHCESCYNKHGIFTGRTNSHLTSCGINHAKVMAQKLKHMQIDLAIHTSLARTKETLVHILKFHPNCKVEVDDRIIDHR